MKPNYQVACVQIANEGSSLDRILVGALLFLTLIAWNGAASAALIDFEDLSASSGTFVPQGYYGFSWLGGGHSGGTASWVNSAFDELCHPTPVCERGTAHSGVNYAWSNGGTELQLSGRGLFDMHYLWISFRANPDRFPDLRVFFEGLSDGVTIFTETILLPNNNNYRRAELGFVGIDTLRFRGELNHNLLVDDISFSAGHIPAPSTLVLIIIGLIGFGYLHKNARLYSKS